MKTKLNIVFIGSVSFPLGLASTKRRRYLIDYLDENSIENHYIVLYHNHWDEFGNDFYGHYKNTDYYDLSPLYFKSFFNHKYFKRGKELLKKHYNPDKKNILLFHTNLEYNSYSLFKYAIDLGYKIVFDQVETSYISNGTNPSLKRKIHVLLNEFFTRKAYKIADGFFVISKSLMKANRSIYPKKPICLLPNSTPILSDSKSTFNSPIIILYSGTFGLKDGVEYLIKGFLKVREKGISCKLILTGKSFNGEEKRLVEKHKDNSDIIFLGFVSESDLKETIVNSDILTMTRVNSEFANFGFPFKLSEYLSTGIPVLATKVSDIEDYLTHMVSAYLIEPENSDAIAEGLEFLINNQEEALIIGKNGLDVMKKHFSTSHVGEIFVDFLTKI